MSSLNKIISENEHAVLRYYRESDKEIKQRILQAALKGSDKRYLEKLHSEVKKEIQKLEDKFKYFSIEGTAKAYKSGVDKTQAEFKQLKIPFEKLQLGNYATFGGIHKEAVKVAAENTFKSYFKITQLIGRDTFEYFQRTNFKDTQKILQALGQFVSSETMRDIGVTGIRGVVVGSESWQQAVLRIEKEFAKQDIFKVPYYTKKDGSLHRMVSARDYVIVVAINTTAESHRTGTANRILETFGDNDLCTIVGPLDEKTAEACADAVGQFYSIEGRTQGYPTIAEYEAAGGFHINCRHDLAIDFSVIEEYEKQGIEY